MLRLLYGPTLTSIHDYWKTHRFDYIDLCRQSDVFAFNVLSRLVIAFLPRSKHLLISLLQSLSAVILEPKKIKVLLLLPFFPLLFATKCKDWMPWLFFEFWVLTHLFHSPLSHSSRGSLVSLLFMPLGWYHLRIWGCWYFSCNLDSSLYRVLTFLLIFKNVNTKPHLSTISS